jgi:hypothetical protein
VLLLLLLLLLPTSKGTGMQHGAANETGAV